MGEIARMTEKAETEKRDSSPAQPGDGAAVLAAFGMTAKAKRDSSVRSE